MLGADAVHDTQHIGALSFHSDGSLEHDPEGEMKNLPRSLLKYLRRFHPPLATDGFFIGEFENERWICPLVTREF